MREVPAYRTKDQIGGPDHQVEVMDQAELDDYKYLKRKEFEEKLRM